MLSEPEVQQLAQLVRLGAFALSALFGALLHHTHFCTMGAIADWVNMGSTTRLRQWALALAVAMLGFGLLAAGGWVRAADSLYATPRWMWLSTLVGGALFGVGMVLASGCGAKALVRLGAGSLKALVVLLVMAVSAYATLRGITAVLRSRSVDQVFVSFSEPATLGHLAAAATGWPLPHALLGAALLGAAPLLAWALADRTFLSPRNLLAGLGVGGLVVAMWWLSGHVGYVAEDPTTLEPAYLAARSGRMEALTFTGPLAHGLEWLLFFSDSQQRLSLGVASALGVAAGAAVHAVLSKRFRWEGFASTEDLVNHLAGGVLMGVGGVTALGCTIGQGLSGASNLSLGSFTALAGIGTGAVLALKYQAWRMERLA